jgi:hypothetical protein
MIYQKTIEKVVYVLNVIMEALKRIWQVLYGFVMNVILKQMLSNRRNTMFDTEERKKELRNVYNSMVTVDVKNDYYRWTTREEKFDLIISQEKFMIEQAKKEAREGFANKIMKRLSFEDDSFAADVIDSLLEEYEVI